LKPMDQLVADIGAALDEVRRPAAMDDEEPEPAGPRVPDRVSREAPPPALIPDAGLPSITRERVREPRQERPARRQGGGGVWRVLTRLMFLVAGSLAGLIAAWRYVPERLPPPLRAEVILGLPSATGTAYRRPAPPESQFDE